MSQKLLEMKLVVVYLGGTKGVAPPKALVAVNDVVSVTSGSFEGRRGVVERVTPRKASVRLRGDPRSAPPRLLLQTQLERLP